MPYELLDHTADLMVGVWARKLPELFVEAARAMFHLLSEAPVRPEKCVNMRVQAEGRDALLVSWLTELLVLHETRLWLFARFDIETLDQSSLTAKAWGERLDPKRHRIEREIKAVTYHSLAIVERDGRFRTKIVFDV